MRSKKKTRPDDSKPFAWQVSVFDGQSKEIVMLLSPPELQTIRVPKTNEKES